MRPPLVLELVQTTLEGLQLGAPGASAECWIAFRLRDGGVQVQMKECANTRTGGVHGVIDGRIDGR
jgi:hypothetical protein